jgi:glyoxylase-like metal-dependent hydrolase (beta-lactamase superfamily II)
MIDLPLPMTGFRHFVTSWVLVEGKTTILIDPGPASSIPRLRDELRRLGIGRPNWVLLTHVHLDHSGGVGHLLRDFPDARVVCHRRGLPHLKDPAKVWEASLGNLSAIAEMYGKPDPVPEENLRTEAVSPAIESVETPGHAPHHLVFRIGDVLFTGEALGIFFPAGDSFYLRVGAPPGGFDYPAYRRSLDRMSALDVSLLCFAHYGYTEEVRRIIGMARDQLDLWMSTALKHAGKKDRIFEDRVIEDLLKNDPALSKFAVLPEDVRERERWHLRHCVAAFRPYLEKR